MLSDPASADIDSDNVFHLLDDLSSGEVSVGRDFTVDLPSRNIDNGVLLGQHDLSNTQLHNMVINAQRNSEVPTAFRDVSRTSQNCSLPFCSRWWYARAKN